MKTRQKCLEYQHYRKKKRVFLPLLPEFSVIGHLNWTSVSNDPSDQICPVIPPFLKKLLSRIHTVTETNLALTLKDILITGFHLDTLILSQSWHAHSVFHTYHHIFIYLFIFLHLHFYTFYLSSSFLCLPLIIKQ